MESVNANNELMVMGTELTMGEDERFIADLTSERKTAFCSLNPKTQAEQVTLFKAMNNPEKRIGDCINMVIEAKDVFVEIVNCTNKETGEIKACPRIVIIDKDGVGYQAVSLGMFSALKKVMMVFGQPSWKTPVKMKIVQITKGDRKLLTFDVV